MNSESKQTFDGFRGMGVAIEYMKFSNNNYNNWKLINITVIKIFDLNLVDYKFSKC